VTSLGGQVALVTGVGNTIGAGIAVRLAMEGVSLFLVDASNDALEATLERLRTHGFPTASKVADSTNREELNASVEACVATFGRLDILINAGDHRQSWQALEDIPDTALTAAFNSQVLGAFWTMQSALPHLRRNAGRIVNVVAVDGDSVVRYRGAYKAACDALKAISQTAAFEWGGDNIRVNVLIPLAESSVKDYRESHSEHVEWALRQLPMQRLGDPVRDIGGAALFLVSEDAQYVTGHVIYADGGQFLAPAVVEPERR